MAPGDTTVGRTPNSRWVVTGSRDTTARLWDLSAKDPAANPVVLRGHEAPVSAVAINPDNHWLVTGSADHTARLSPLQVKDLIDLARVMVGRNLTTEEWKQYLPGEQYRKTFPALPGPQRPDTQATALRGVSSTLAAIYSKRPYMSEWLKAKDRSQERELLQLELR